MRRKFTLILFCLLLIAAVGCSKRSSASVLIVDIPKGFNGNFVLEMGNRSAAPLRGKATLMSSRCLERGR